MNANTRLTYFIKKQEDDGQMIVTT